VSVSDVLCNSKKQICQLNMSKPHDIDFIDENMLKCEICVVRVTR
jgi:hypothetical protein